jgi:nucleotide-binding universal stress UspA family protein
MFATPTILFATDFSERSEPMFQQACALARERGARLLALHVAPRSVYGLAVAQRDEYQRRWDVLHEFHCADPDVELDHQLRHGDPAREIVRVASQVRCELIVLAMHRPRALTRLLTGAVVDEVARRAPCPVVSGDAPIARAALSAV